jgi:hypothetical protein
VLIAFPPVGLVQTSFWASVRVWRRICSIFVELRLAADQRRRHLHDHVATVVGPAVQAVIEQRSRQEAAAADAAREAGEASPAFSSYAEPCGHGAGPASLM